MYRVYRSDDSFTYSLFAAASYNYFDNYSVTSNQYYYYKVSALDGSGNESEHSSPVKVQAKSCQASPAVLNVNSSGASSVYIARSLSSDPFNLGGYTNYSRTYTSNLSGRLRAPETASNGTVFSSWSGCDSVEGTNNRWCRVNVNLGETQTIIANYSLSTSINKKSPCGSFGDINLDGYVTKEDYTLLLNYVAGTSSLTTNQKIWADVSANGIISGFDASQIQQYVGGYITTFPACSK